MSKYLHDTNDSHSWQVIAVRRARFRAIITLDPAGPPASVLHPPAQQYLNHTRSLVVRTYPRQGDRCTRYFPAEICWDTEQPLHPGDHAIVTITVTDDQADAHLGAGQQFALWSGGDVGHGILTRKVYTDHSPS